MQPLFYRMRGPGGPGARSFFDNRVAKTSYLYHIVSYGKDGVWPATGECVADPAENTSVEAIPASQSLRFADFAHIMYVIDVCAPGCWADFHQRDGQEGIALSL